MKANSAGAQDGILRLWINGTLTHEYLTVEYDAGGYAVRPLDGFCATVSDGSLAVLEGLSEGVKARRKR